MEKYKNDVNLYRKSEWNIGIGKKGDSGDERAIREGYEIKHDPNHDISLDKIPALEQAFMKQYFSTKA